jgi:hypothetical protein
MASVKGVRIVTLEARKGRIQHFPARHDNDVQAGSDLMTPEDLSSEPLGAISLNRDTELPAGGNTQPRHRTAVASDEEGHEPPGDPNTGCVRALKIDASPNALARRQPERPDHDYCSSDTVRRLRPLVRRRLRTIRPFFVAMRTLNPCVFLRRLVFG